ncbi:GNAT family N-acetyltransferase [Paenibacillus hemerocallicola]|uniref:GNAT family N-acetyltransferase n=1 Tax=Paenibacillus hemerocallicola TaxID=1172614 RepID=A0A5C4SYQ3_9BACL|nr:GNAT family protein [Paenibacillus hemerocallicola]TNJ61934.1 GNAT family N-acetyltransferase [Paenibacillus hemerocallicola]
MRTDAVTLEGERAMLIPLQVSHAEQLFQAVDSSEVWTFLPSRMEKLEDMTHHVVEALQDQEQGTEVPFVVYDKQTGQVVGMTRLLNIAAEHRSLEIGWTWYSSKVWRTRVNTECKFLLLSYCFEVKRTIRVQFRVDSRNTRSNEAVARIGGTKEGVLRKDRTLYDGYVRDTVVYSILDEEWPAVKQKLQTILA